MAGRSDFSSDAPRWGLGENEFSALAPDAAPAGDNRGWAPLPDLPAAGQQSDREMADRPELAASPPHRGHGSLVLVGLGVFGAVAVVGIVIAVWLNSDARLRARLAGSWEARSASIHVSDSIQVDSVIVKCRFAPDTDSRGRNLTLNVMPTHLRVKNVALPLPDIVPSVHGVWKVRDGDVVVRLEKIDHRWAAWAVPLLEKLAGQKLLHEELVLAVARVDDGQLVLTNGLIFERCGR
jgi:hypothetical protein